MQRIPKKSEKHSVSRKWLLIVGLAIIIGFAGVVWGIQESRLKPARTSLGTEPHQLTALQCAEALPLNTLIGQVLTIGLQASSMTSQAPLFKSYRLGGAVLMDAPANPLDGSIQKFKKAGGQPGDPLLISTDEEGGEIQRFAVLGQLPSPAQVAQTLTPPEAERLIAAHAAKLKTAGVDVVLGPLVDVMPVIGQNVLGDRTFSSDPQTVANYAAAYVQGWQSAGILPTLKHFPGLGSASGNTDFGPATTLPLSLLKVRDFIPYQKLVNSGAAVMVGNQTVPGWFSGPASLSPEVDKYLRDTLGYKDSLVLTDSLSAGAVTDLYSIPNAVVKSLEAGNDMPLVVGSDMSYSANQALIAQIESALKGAITDGSITKQRLAVSVSRKLKTQGINACSL